MLPPAGVPHKLPSPPASPRAHTAHRRACVSARHSLIAVVPALPLTFTYYTDVPWVWGGVRGRGAQIGNQIIDEFPFFNVLSSRWRSLDRRWLRGRGRLIRVGPQLLPKIKSVV